MCFDDVLLSEHFLYGFPLLGTIPLSDAPASPLRKEAAKASEEDLRQARAEGNHLVLSKLKPTEWEEDLSDIWAADFELGAMSEAELVTPEVLSSVSLTRRLAVRELRSKGWRTRAVDHFTESGINGSTQVQDSPSHDTLDVLASIIHMFLQHGQHCHMWKRDVSKAFRRLPIALQHLEFAWVVWLNQGHTYMAQHRGMPFGAISSVYGWHRAGNFLLAVVTRLCLAPAAKYVDDFFGASKSQLIGLPCDEAKDADDALLMVVLGAQVSLSFYPEPKLTMKVDEDKASRWASALQTSLVDQVMSPGEAAKLAGKLSFAVTVQANKVGRAFVKPFFAQSHDPLQGNVISSLLRQAIMWWIEYLTLRPPAVRKFLQQSRQQTVVWTDASGEGWLGAVLHLDGHFLYTRMLAPSHITDQLLPRADCQIAFLEFLAVALALETFSRQLVGTALT
eukprot:2299382-Amphidinium_carterae.1